MLLLSRQDIEAIFTMKEGIEAVKEAFKLFTQGKSQVPLRTQVRAENGTFLFMPAYSSELSAASLKAVSIFPDNLAQGLPAAPAQVLLINGQTGIVDALLDGTVVTQLRTGAATGVAFDVLGRKTAKRGALIGTGGQAACQLEAMLCGRELEEVRVAGNDYQKTAAFVAEMTDKLKTYGTTISAVATGTEAIKEADLIVTVTSSTTPVFDGSVIKKGATISCVGSYQPHMQELDPLVLTKASKVYFDSEEAVLSEAGDILIPLADGTITAADFTGDLGAVLLGDCVGRENEEEIIVFKTVGIGTQDLVTAKAIYEKAKGMGVGTQWG